ncbi:MAG: hypothetical protein H6581_29060 [Bacteroidia bacterium]|nr:hypothetical protein [Bacteroidia bacterium]
MNALYIFFLFFTGLFGQNGTVAKSGIPQIHQDVKLETRNIHRFNPKTVVALEDTHFRPND